MSATLWLALAGMAAVTYALRASFLVMPPGVQTPEFLRRALRFVPAAVLTAIWAPELLLQDQVLYLSAQNERLLAGLVAIGVAWRWRAIALTIAAGLTALHFFDWLT